MIMTMQYKKRLIYFLLITAILKIIISGIFELGNDEVYYYTYALQPDWNHFDHPPMVGIFMQITSLNLKWLNEISLRLGSVIGCTISTFFIFNIGKIISSEKNGWFAAIIYNVSIYTGFIAGLFILPDSPQMPFWTASLYIMCRLICKDETTKTANWLLLGIAIGLAALSKIHGLYLWVGFGLFIIIKRVKWLMNWRLYAAGLITLLILLPIVYWNVQNNFITYKFHSERVTHHHILLNSFIHELVGEFAYQNPIIFILLLVSVVYLFRRGNMFSSVTTTWLLCMSLPMIFLFWGVSLFNETLPHWSGPAFIPLFFIAAKYLEIESDKKIYPAYIKYAGFLVGFVLLVAVIIIKFAPFNLGSQKEENYGEYCPTLDLSGWKTFGNEFSNLVKADIQSGKMPSTAVIVANKWFPAGHIEFYVARKANLQLIAIGKLEDVHKFAWLNKNRYQLHEGDDAYCIVPSNVPTNVNEVYGQYFSTIENPIIYNQIRGGKVVRFFYVYRLKNCKQVPDTILP